MPTGISNCRHIPDGEMSSSKAVDLHLRPVGSFQQTSTISAHSIRISARGRCMPVLSAGLAARIRGGPPPERLRPRAFIPKNAPLVNSPLLRLLAHVDCFRIADHPPAAQINATALGGTYRLASYS